MDMADILAEKPLIDKLLKKNILVIDDDGIITKTLCDLLKRAGYYADKSQDGYEAIDKSKEEIFDLIICDIKMPNIDGIETIQHIQKAAADQSRPMVPVIFITGYADSEAASQARKMGEVLLKPFETKEFLDKVARYI